LFSWVRRLVDVRQSCPEIGWGEWSIPAVDNPAVFALRFTWEDKSVLVLHNLAKEDCQIAPFIADVERAIAESW
jgi:maltose alpha-D-glucosyltransferase / alpha-amylase